MKIVFIFYVILAIKTEGQHNKLGSVGLVKHGFFMLNLELPLL